MRSPLLQILRRLRSEQRGQSLIVVSLAMVVVLGVSALAIDVGTWYVRHHQDQVIADSAALAAANCLANPNTGPNTSTMPQCTSGTDTGDAKQVAVAYAARNGLQISPNQVTISSNTVQVKATSNTPAFFANMLGISTTTESAHAIAGWNSAVSTTCTLADESAGECYAIYAQNAACGSNDGWVVGSTGLDIVGAVHTQGALNMNPSGGTYTLKGPFTYSSSNCTYVPNQETTYSSGSSTPTAGGNEPASYWPLDFSTVFTACGPTDTYQCVTINGQPGLPSYCTDESTNVHGFVFGWSNNGTEPYSGHVYCSVGTGNPSNPATWNGPITFSDGASAGTSSSPLSATFIGGYINATSSTLDLAPGLDNCLFYALDTDAAASSSYGSSIYAIELQNGTYTFGGTMFSPNGTINLGSTAGTAGFLEGQNVNTSNLNYTGNGPVDAASGSSSSTGTDSLVQ
jgi:Putative Flp pilus-assembly TadE/G-like